MMHIDDLCRAVLDKTPLNHSDSAGDRLVGFAAALSIWADDNEAIRIAPTLKPVDMSVLRGSGIDCQFADSEDGWRPWSSRLNKIAGRYYHPDSSCVYRADGAFAFTMCRPRQDYWHSLHNCPVKDGEGPFSTKTFHQLRAAGFDVRQAESGKIFYFIGVLVGRCYPWEAS